MRLILRGRQWAATEFTKLEYTTKMLINDKLGKVLYQKWMQKQMRREGKIKSILIDEPEDVSKLVIPTKRKNL